MYNLIAVVIISLTVNLLQFGPLKGSIAALVASFALQVGLMGFLLTRALRLRSLPHPLVVATTIIFAGLMMSVTTGAVFRYLRLPVPAYIVTMHILMFILALAPSEMRRIHWHFRRHNIPICLTLLVCCLTLMAFGLATAQLRFAGELTDRGLFASLIDWLAHSGGEAGLFNRQLLYGHDLRMEIDGWTYASAAWVYGGGFSGGDYLWHLQIPLVIWIAPLAIFSLTYALSRSVLAATWAVAALTFLGILTYDVRFYFPMAGFSGRHPLFDLRTLREVALAILLPLSLFAWAITFRSRRPQWFIMLGIAALALASVHPRALLVFLLFIAGAELATLLAGSRGLFNRRSLLVAMVALAPITIVGIALVRNRLPDFLSSPLESEACVGSLEAVSSTWQVVQAVNLPLVGPTYIFNPAVIFYHPIVTAAFVVSILFGLRRRRSITGAFLLAPAVLFLTMLVALPLSRLLAELFSVNLVLGDLCQLDNIFVRNLLDNMAGAAVLSLILPVIIGITLWHLIPSRQATRVLLRYATLGFTVLALMLTIFEPVPVPVSARDQLRAIQDGLQHLTVKPADLQVANALSELVTTEADTIVLAPVEAAGAIVENVPHTLIVTEDASGYGANAYRFFNIAMPPQPWLDANDIDFLNNAAIDYVITRITDTRYPQLVLDTGRFERVRLEAGYAIFRVREHTAPDTTSQLFVEMNRLFGSAHDTIWEQQGLADFHLNVVSDQDAIQDVIARWHRLMTEAPETSLANYGLAFSFLLAGEPDKSVPLWNELYKKQPILVEPLALSLALAGQELEGTAALRASLNSSEPDTRLIAAKNLLTQRFLHLLSSDAIETLLRVIDEQAAAWEGLTRDDYAGLLQERIELLMARGFWKTAAEWIDKIPRLEIRSEEYAMQGLALLAQGNVDRALAHLEIATGPDWLAPRADLHPDRWEPNVAAQQFALLSGNVAEREGRAADAEQFYLQAIGYGAEWLGRYSLANLKGDSSILADVERTWSEYHDTPLPQLVPLLTIADTGRIYVSQIEISREAGEDNLNGWATFGSAFERQFPIQMWRFHLRSPDTATIYVDEAVPATAIPGALLRFPIRLVFELDNMPELAQARLFVEAMHNNAVVMGQTDVSLVLNRPPSADLPDDAALAEARFGDHIILKGYTLDATPEHVDITAYWTADQPLTEDYQVSIKVLDESGAIVIQQDTGPAADRYPTSQWRANTLIEDFHSLEIDTPLPKGSYHVTLVVYSLSDLRRLPIEAANTMNDAELLLGTFEA